MNQKVTTEAQQGVAIEQEAHTEAHKSAIFEETHQGQGQEVTTEDTYQGQGVTTENAHQGQGQGVITEVIHQGQGQGVTTEDINQEVNTKAYQGVSSEDENQEVTTEAHQRITTKYTGTGVTYENTNQRFTTKSHQGYNTEETVTDYPPIDKFTDSPQVMVNDQTDTVITIMSTEPALSMPEDTKQTGSLANEIMEPNASEGEIVVEAADQEEVEEEPVADIVDLATYKMSTLARLGLEIGITLEHLRTGRVVLSITMAEEEDTEIGKDQANVPEGSVTDYTTFTPEEGATSEDEAVTSSPGHMKTPATPDSMGRQLPGQTAVPAMLYLIADGVACRDLGAAVASGLTVTALPLAELRAVASAREYVQATWLDIRRGECLAILKTKDEAPTLSEAVSGDFETVEARSSRSSGPILRTVGLATSFGGLSLGSFTLISSGVTGRSRMSKARQNRFVFQEPLQWLQ